MFLFRNLSSLATTRNGSTVTALEAGRMGRASEKVFWTAETAAAHVDCFRRTEERYEGLVDL